MITAARVRMRSGRLALWPWLPLLPWLIWQGRRVRRITPRLPEPAGAREGRLGDGPPLRLLILGDSAAAGVGVAHQDAALAGQLVQRLAPHHAVHWRLLAGTGHRSEDALRLLQAESGLCCDVVLTSLGVNDATALMPAADFVAAQRRLLAHLREHTGARLLLVSGLPPVHAFPALPQPLRRMLGTHARRLDAALADWLATQPDAEHLAFGELRDATQMASDGFHPGAAVYAQWADAVAMRIRARLMLPE